LSHAVQFIEISLDDINTLNKRLQWQIINQIRELRYVKLN
jgi:L-ribulose-5-phosphate 3-epimerase UlaE